ncbi:MAG: ABC transporter permease [Bacteroidia bacterium]|nr:ABC transporter permease [Bacteroidia bacterium]
MISVIIGGLLIGFILTPLALGVFISYRMLRFPDLTVDGAFACGAVVSARMVLYGWDPLSATLLGMCGGAVAGLLTGLLATRFGIRRLLAGILVMTALYSVNLYILGKPSHAFNEEITLYNWAREVAVWFFGPEPSVILLGSRIFTVKLVSLVFAGCTSVLIVAGLYWLFKTQYGLAMRAAGDNPEAAAAMGVNVERMVIIALALANALAALSGSIFAQELGSAGFDLGLGMIVTGLACVIVGGALFRRSRFSMQLVATVIGTLLYRLIISLLLLAGVVSTDLRLFTAVFVLLALLVPSALDRWLRQGQVPVKGVQ